MTEAEILAHPLIVAAIVGNWRVLYCTDHDVIWGQQVPVKIEKWKYLTPKGWNCSNERSCEYARVQGMNPYDVALDQVSWTNPKIAHHLIPDMRWIPYK